MPLPSSIYRILLALLMLSSSLAGEAAPAVHANGAQGGKIRTAAYCVNAADVRQERDHHPQDAVLSGSGYVSSAVTLQSGYAGGADGYTTANHVFLAATSLLHGGSEPQLRRWRLLASAARQAQLRALYPAHHFW